MMSATSFFQVPTLTFLALLFVSASCAECDGETEFALQPNLFASCLPKWAVNRTSSLGTNAPIGMALNAQGSKAVEVVRIITDHFEREEGRLRELMAQTVSRANNRFEYSRERPCNVFNKKASDVAFSVNLSTTQYGFGVLPTFCTKSREKCGACTTDLDEPGSGVKRIADAIRNFTNVLRYASSEAVRSSGLEWEDPRTYMNFTFRSNTDVCRVLHASGFRVRGRWGVNTGITDGDPGRFLGERKRKYLVEILRVENGEIVPILMNVRKNTSNEFSFVNATTTVLNAWSGTPQLSLFESNVQPEENPAIGAVLDMGGALLQQVQTSLSAGGISILITPIVLTLIPLAAVSDENSGSLIIYTIATDVLTTLPLLIKGIELVIYGTRKHETMRSRIYGALNKDDVAVMETWYAKCEATTYIAVLGHIFIGIAIVFMLIGIGFELYAKRVFKAKALLRKRVGKKKAAAFEAAWYSPPCNCENGSDCECSCALLNRMTVFRCDTYGKV